MSPESNVRSLSIGIFGAGGLVGETLLGLLADRPTLDGRVRLLTTVGRDTTPIGTHWGPRPVEIFDPTAPPELDLALLAIPAEASRRLTPVLLRSGTSVVDCSSAHRDSADVPLVIPEINGVLLDDGPRLVASPNCTTTIALMAIEPIRRAAGLRRVSMCSYQAVSGAGRGGLADLDRQLADAAEGRPPTAGHFPDPILLNLFCHESPEDDAGENEEERKIRTESRRILGLPDLPIAATCVRVATRRAHAISISLETGRETTRAELLAQLRAADGLRVCEAIPHGSARSEAGLRLQPIDAETRPEVLVGRLRADRSGPPGRAWSIFVVGDQLLKGAALNVIQIAERLTRHRFG